MSYKSHVVKRALYVRSSRRLYSVRDASDCIGEKIVASAPVYSSTQIAGGSLGYLRFAVFVFGYIHITLVHDAEEASGR